MANGVEGCSEVKEDQYVEVPRVCREGEIVCDFQESGFGAVLWAESRLEWFIQFTREEVGFDLRGDNAFQNF